MYRILKIGMDVHTTNYTLCALESKFGEEDTVLANITVGPDHKNVLDFVRRIKEKMDPKGKDPKTILYNCSLFCCRRKLQACGGFFTF